MELNLLTILVSYNFIVKKYEEDPHCNFEVLGFSRVNQNKNLRGYLEVYLIVPP